MKTITVANPDIKASAVAARRCFPLNTITNMASIDQIVQADEYKKSKFIIGISVYM